MSRVPPLVDAFAQLDQLDNLRRVGRAEEIHLQNLRQIEEMFAAATGASALDAYRLWRESGFRRSPVPPLTR